MITGVPFIMKKTILLVLSLLFCLSAFAGCTADPTESFAPAGLKKISNEDADHVLYVPTSWIADLSTGVTTAYVSVNDRSSISFMSFELDNSIFDVEIGGSSVTTTDAETTTAETTTAETTTEAETTTAETTVPASDTSDTSVTTALPAETAGAMPTIESIDEYWDYYESMFALTFTDMTYTEKGENMLLSQIAAKKYIYSATVTGQSYRFMQVVAIKSGTVYIFTYTATPDSFDKHIEDVTKILENLAIK